ncbi:hypothetical protein A2943_02410 [Candidatus Adlerbacteria bacterium RIFCSPLOWO2_01_FULL_51_16]|uniref:DUF1905 domain-containing protein n=1 Tax=Candidatus Adlerbacteria bacterium RIFCSPLOWO2_01_FULL_51_16 TaxID=1797243 RepID=A0A1F4XGH3_9BACT|nr:MAG: hypothetical protein A2943_02410 [Candidatus Adlerbacteria bacterium RIFCSPLOWO2_01_FULL_51_16]
MQKKVYKTRAKVWLYPGSTAAWHFIFVDKKYAKELKEKFGKVKRGFGSIPVVATIGKTSWQTSIFPDKRAGTYLLPLKLKVRQAEHFASGDTITFFVQVR